MFSAPLWLFGLVSLLIPLALHLWSRKPRQVIRVGTLRHVELTADARSWSARLTDPLLLLVRLALLTTIVFALAGLRLPVRRSAGSAGSLILVEPALLKAPAALPFLDSLVREEASVRLLLPGLPTLRLGGWFPDAAVTTDIWGPMAEADALVGAEGVIHVIATPRMAVLRGVRPRIRAAMVWHAPPVADRRESEATVWWKGDSTAWRVHIVANDSASAQRIAVAVRAISAETGIPVVLAGVTDSADLAISGEPLDDAILRVPRPLIVLSPATIADNSLADSIWAQWPSPARFDSSDVREASVGQALASRPTDPPAPLGNPEATRRGLLLLALLLFTVERWLATRAARHEA